MTTPLAIDLFCGLGGWTDGLLSDGYRVIGFDIEQHAYRWFQDGAAQHGSKSNARKAASAHIAKIPFELARYIGLAWFPYRAGLWKGVT